MGDEYVFAATNKRTNEQYSHEEEKVYFVLYTMNTRKQCTRSKEASKKGAELLGKEERRAQQVIKARVRVTCACCKVSTYYN